MSADLRVGVIGAGFIGRVHMERFAAADGVSVVACADMSPELRAAAAKKYGLDREYADASALIEDREIDAVVVAVPNRFHAPLTIEALNAGKHVLVEKPMGLDQASAKEIYNASASSGKTVMVAHQMRWMPAVQEAKRMADAGELGKVYNAKCGMMRRKNIPGWGSWFTRMNESGGGPLIDIGVHVLDMTMWLLGDPKPVSVFGSTYAEFGPRKKGLGSWGTPDWNGIFDVEDLATAMIKMDDGSTLTLDVSWAVNTLSDNKHQIDLMGTEGGVSIRGNDLTFTAQKFDRPIDVATTPAGPDARDLLAQHFVDCIKSGKRPISDALSGLVNNTILSAIYDSARAGTAVTLDWSDIEG